MIWLVIVLLFLLATLNYLRFRDLMYPGLWHAAIWLVTVLLFGMNQEKFIPLSSIVLGLVLAGACFFTLGSYVATFRHRPWLQRNLISEKGVPSNVFLTALLVIVAVGFFGYAIRAYALATSGPTDSWSINLRYAVSVNTDVTGGFGVWAYFLPLSNAVTAAVILAKYGAKRAVPNVMLIASLGLSVGFGGLTMGRGFLIFIMVLVLGILLLLRKIRPTRAFLILCSLTIVLFFFGGVLLNKGGSLENTLADNIRSISESIVLYVSGGLPALGQFVRLDRPPELGANTFRTFYAILGALGFHVRVAPLVQEFTLVPMPTNLYTVYQAYIKDFGLMGSVAIQFVFGFLHGLAYRGATQRSPKVLYVFFYAISLFALVTQYGPDSYFSLLSMWLQYAFYGIVMFQEWIRFRVAGAGKVV